MCKRIVLFFVLASLGFAPAPFPRKEPLDDPAGEPSADLNALQGRWRVKSYRIAGREQDAKSLHVEISGERLIFSTHKENNTGFTEWTFSLNATRRLRRFDLPNKTSPARGIYRLKGRVLTICIALPGDARPNDFRTTSGRWHLVLEHE